MAGHRLFEEWKQFSQAFDNLDLDELGLLETDDKFRAYTFALGTSDRRVINQFKEFTTAEKRTAHTNESFLYYNPVFIFNSFTSANKNANVDASGSSTSSSSGGGTGGGGGGSGAIVGVRGKSEMKKLLSLSIISLLLLVLSFGPMFGMIRETIIDMKLKNRYVINHAYTDEFGFKDIVDVDELIIGKHKITIKEGETGLKGSRTPWDIDEGVPPGDIVKIHLLLNNKEITTSDEIWLSNRERGSRYFSWLDIVTVHDRKSGENLIKIVQRLTDDDELGDAREWKIITISPDGSVTEEKMTYAERSKNALGVSLVNFTNTGLIAMGHRTDILKGYPSLFFPFIYPFLTSLVGIVLLLIAIQLIRNKRKIKGV